VDEPRIDAHAGIHLRRECSGLPQREIACEVVDMRRHVVADIRAQGIVCWDVAAIAAEDNFSAAAFDEPFDEGRPACGGPMPFRGGASHGHKHAWAIGGEPCQKRCHAVPRVGVGPVLGVSVIDRDAFGAEQVEIAIGLVTPAGHRDASSMEQAAVAGEPDSLGDAGEGGEESGGE